MPSLQEAGNMVRTLLFRSQNDVSKWSNMSACEIVLVRFLYGNQTLHVGLVQSRHHLMKAYPCSPHDIPVAENLHILLFTYMFTQAYPCSPHDIPVAENLHILVFTYMFTHLLYQFIRSQINYFLLFKIYCLIGN